MGFPDSFKLIGSSSKLYNRVGNSIVIPMVEEIAKQVKKQLLDKNIDSCIKKFQPRQMCLFD